MSDPTPYVYFPGTAREALTFYAQTFGCRVTLHTFEEFGRDDGPANAIAHGYLTDGAVTLFGTDVAGEEQPLSCEGLVFALLGTAEPVTLRAWFDELSNGGQVIEPLEARPWGATDGRVRDRFGLTWLIGYEAG
jgi:PhnB protein